VAIQGTGFINPQLTQVLWRRITRYALRFIDDSKVAFLHINDVGRKQSKYRETTLSMIQMGRKVGPTDPR